jgi:hypothetical protein
MKKLSVALGLALMFLTARPAFADRIHLACDPNVAASVGYGAFDGRTSDISFERKQFGYSRLELGWRACKGRVPRRNWFNRLTAYLTVSPENSDLAYEQKPGILKDENGEIVYQTDENGAPILDEDMQPIPRTEDTITRAELHTNIDVSGGAGLAITIYGSRKWSLEVFGEFAGTPFYNPAYVDALTAHVLEGDFDVAPLGRDHVDVEYKWGMAHVGATVGTRRRPDLLMGAAVVPYLTLGYAWFRADIRAKVDEELRQVIEALGGDVAIVEKPRTIRKSSPTLSAGTRVDFGRNFSLSTNFMFGATRHTTVFWTTVDATLRFDIF